jgi:hypothetical protein
VSNLQAKIDKETAALTAISNDEDLYEELKVFKDCTIG